MTDQQHAELLAALHAHTQAINSLADSNRELVDYLVSREDEDGEAPTGVYLDGEPCR